MRGRLPAVTACRRAAHVVLLLLAILFVCKFVAHSTPLEAEELPPCAKLLIDATRRAGPEHRSLYRTHQVVRNASTHETVNAHSTSDHPLPLLQHRGACSDCTQDGEARWNTGAEQLLTPPVRVEAFEPEVRWGGLVHAMDEMLTPYLDRVSKLGGIVRKDVYWPAAELLERERWCGSVLRVKLYDGHVYIEGVPASPSWTNYGGQQGFMAARRRSAVRAITQAVEHAKADFAAVRTTILICTADGHELPSVKAALNPVGGAVRLNAAQSPVTGAIPFPHMDVGQGDPHMNTVEKTMSWRNKYPWHNRSAKAVFRGGSRQCWGDGEMSEFSDKFEQSAVMVEGGHPVGREAQCMRDEMVRQMWGCGKGLVDAGVGHSGGAPIPLPDQEAYKLVIYAGGNMGWADRLKHLLAMQSTIIFQHNLGGMEWFAHLLEPWVHYIPVDHLFRNLADVVAWANGNDVAVQQISKNADEFVRFFLSPASINVYISRLLLGLAGLTRFVTDIADTDLLVTSAGLAYLTPDKLGALVALAETSVGVAAVLKHALKKKVADTKTEAVNSVRAAAAKLNISLPLAGVDGWGLDKLRVLCLATTDGLLLRNARPAQGTPSGS